MDTYAALTPQQKAKIGEYYDVSQIKDNIHDRKLHAYKYLVM